MKSFLSRFLAGRTAADLVLICALAASVLFSLISISLAEGFLAIALAAWIILLILKKRRFETPKFFWALAAYAALSLVSSAASVNPKMSFWDSRELLLILAVPIVLAAIRRREDLVLLLGAFVLSAAANGLYAVGYRVLVPRDPNVDIWRIKSFMGHYMTEAGITALFIAFALGILFAGFARRAKSPAGAGGRGLFTTERIVWGTALVIAAAANVLTYARGAWIGIGAALVVAIFLWKPKALIVLPVIAVLGLVAAPKSIRDRALSIFTLRDNSNIARVQYFKAGLKIIGDYPLLGTGPDTVDMVFQDSKYGLGEYAIHNVHLHSNAVQIAAERGIVTLLAWLAFLVLAAIGTWPLCRPPRDSAAPPEALLRRKVAAGTLAMLAAFFFAGFFEYNFGDSEIAQLLLVLTALPFAAHRLEREAHGPNHAA